MFKALVLNETEDGVKAAIEELSDDDLPEGDVLVEVSHSTLNYKDGLVLGGLGNLVRQYPHVGGIDFSGTVIESSHGSYQEGDEVLLTGWRVGEIHWGGYSQRARVNGDWLVPLPKGLRREQAMAIGTAGFTAMLAIVQMEDNGLTIDSGPVLVTGAAGGVGSIAASILSNLGYEVHGSTGRQEEAEYLKSIGVSEIIARDELAESPQRPIAKERWAGCVDSVGGNTLANVLTQMQYYGNVASIGLAGGNKLNTTVIPFIIRGVNLLGIDSVMAPKAKREAVWQRLATQLPMDNLMSIVETATLEDLPQLGASILKGGVRGRTVVELAGS